MKPLKNKLMLDIKEIKIGMIQSDSIEEHGTIIAVGPDVDSEVFKIGATLYFKAWQVDVITKDGEKYYFLSADGDSICAIE